MGDLGKGLEIRNIVPGVSNGLNEDSLCPVINGSANVLGVGAGNEFGCDSKSWKHDLHLVVSAAVQAAGRDDVVTLGRKGGNGHELGCLAGRGCDGGNTAFEGSDALLEDIDSGLSRTKLDSERYAGRRIDVRS